MATARVISILRTIQRVKYAPVGCQHIRHATSEAQCTPGQWQMVSAVCLQRPPVVTADLTQLEHKYRDLLADLELESSILSDHELRAIEDRVIAEKKQQADEHDKGEGEVEGARVTALDLEDAWEAEAREFTPAARLTDDDDKSDCRSLDQKLDQPLYLLVKQTLGDQCHWVFPQGPRQEGESMRQAAERILQTQCGEGTQAEFLGNAPCGFHQYTFPQSANIGTGAKVFFFKAWYKGGEETLASSGASTDYTWVTMDQLPQFCSKSYLKSVREFLVPL